MENDSPAKKRLKKYLLKRNPNLSEKELSSLLHDIRRFVSVVQKIYSEPQAHIYFKETKVNGQKIKNKIIETDIEEVGKLVKKTGGHITENTFREFTKQILEKTSKKHGK